MLIALFIGQIRAIEVILMKRRLTDMNKLLLIISAYIAIKSLLYVIMPEKMLKLGHSWRFESEPSVKSEAIFVVRFVAVAVLVISLIAVAIALFYDTNFVKSFLDGLGFDFPERYSLW